MCAFAYLTCHQYLVSSLPDLMQLLKSSLLLFIIQPHSVTYLHRFEDHAVIVLRLESNKASVIFSFTLLFSKLFGHGQNYNLASFMKHQFRVCPRYKNMYV